MTLRRLGHFTTVNFILSLSSPALNRRFRTAAEQLVEQLTRNIFRHDDAHGKLTGVLQAPSSLQSKHVKNAAGVQRAQIRNGRRAPLKVRQRLHVLGGEHKGARRIAVNENGLSQINLLQNRADRASLKVNRHACRERRLDHGATAKRRRIGENVTAQALAAEAQCRVQRIAALH